MGAAVLGLLPLAAMIAGTAHEIVKILSFGTTFSTTCPACWGMIIFGAGGKLVMIRVSHIAIVTGCGGQAPLSLDYDPSFAGPLVPLAVIGQT